MRLVFVDSAHYVAVLSIDDTLHVRALAISAELSAAADVQFVTTDAVLVEVLAYYSRFGAEARVRTADMVSKVLGDPRVTVVPQTPALFDAGLDLYRRRPDKSYSMCDLYVDGSVHRAPDCRRADGGSRLRAGRLQAPALSIFVAASRGFPRPVGRALTLCALALNRGVAILKAQQHRTASRHAPPAAAPFAVPELRPRSPTNPKQSVTLPRARAVTPFRLTCWHAEVLTS